jgi:hypothetical protein
MKNRLAAETEIIAQLLRMLLTFRFHTATITVTTSTVPTEDAAATSSGATSKYFYLVVVESAPVFVHSNSPGGYRRAAHRVELTRHSTQLFRMWAGRMSAPGIRVKEWPQARRGAT